MQYKAPDAARLNASTLKLSKAVDASHASARKAQAAITTARARQKEIAAEVRKLKDVPPALLEKIDQQDATLDDAAKNQGELETHLVEADTAKVQAQKDKVEYFAGAQKVADKATEERNYRIKAEKQLSIQRWYGWLWKIGIFLVIGAVVLFFVLKITGKLGLVAAKIGLKL